MASQQLISKLNHALNREVSTFLRYMLQAASIKGAGHASVRQMYLDEVADEVGHAQYLANTIVMLGGQPALKPDLTPPPDEVSEMLRHDIAEERTDTIGYMDLATIADKEGLVDVKMKMEEQAADEAEHGREMERLLG
jgi:bacterioferritin